eukprot:scaffold1770_cov375-Prasinococcus_capsulatus_cf.AAC.11
MPLSTVIEQPSSEAPPSADDIETGSFPNSKVKLAFTQTEAVAVDAPAGHDEEDEDLGPQKAADEGEVPAMIGQCHGKLAKLVCELKKKDLLPKRQQTRANEAPTEPEHEHHAHAHTHHKHGLESIIGLGMSGAAHCPLPHGVTACDSSYDETGI